MDTTYTTSSYNTTNVGDPGLFFVSMMIIFTIMFLPIILLVVVPAIIGLWKTFTKAHQPGWASIVPIYNTVVMLKIVGRPVWWIVLLLVPFVSIVVSLVVFVDLARAFGKDLTFGILTWLFSPIMLLIIGFNKEIQYVGPVAEGTDMFSGFHDNHPQSAVVTPPMPTTTPVEGTTIPASSESPAASVPPVADDQNKTV